MTVSFEGFSDAAKLKAVYEEMKLYANMPDAPFVAEKAAVKVPNTPYIYITSSFVTSHDEDVPFQYQLWGVEYHTSATSTEESFSYLKGQLKSKLANGEIKGFYILSSLQYPMQPDVPIKMKPSYCHHEFQAKPKVFINGPKKNNEFLKKKGKHYA